MYAQVAARPNHRGVGQRFVHPLAILPAIHTYGNRRQPVQRPYVITTREHFVSLARVFQRSFRQECNDGVDLRIDTLNLGEVGFHYFTTGDGSGANTVGEFGCGPETEVGGSHMYPLS